MKLGLSGNPNIDIIKSAFRKSLLSVHPDINKNDPFASDKTRDVVEAYEILTRGNPDTQNSNHDANLGIVHVQFAFEGDSITATQIKTGTDDLYVGCYSGKIYLLQLNGKHKFIYDSHAAVRKIKERGNYLYVITDQFWDILLKGTLVNRISGSFRLNRILLEETCNAEIINNRIIRLYSLGGIVFADVEFRDPVADAFMVDKMLKVVTGKKSYTFVIQPPPDYKVLADKSLFLP